jgi:hypothetical protein
MFESAWAAMTPATTFIVPALRGVMFTISVPLVQGHWIVVPIVVGLFWS